MKFQTFFFQGLDGAWLRHYSWRCQPVDWTDNPMAMRVSSSTVSWYLVGFAKNPFAFFFHQSEPAQVARGCYVYFLAKISELLDTVFFTLRKKDNQISFLHLYHHTVMPMISWGATKYFPGGHGTFIGLDLCFFGIC